MRFIAAVLVSFVCLSGTSAAQSRWKTIKPVTDTSGLSELVVFHCECTGSRDIDVDSGTLKMPDSLVKHIGKQPTMDIPDRQWNKIFAWNEAKTFKYMFVVRGKITNVTDLGYVPKAGPRYIPLFDVYQYKIFKKELVFSSGPELGLKWVNVDSLFGPLPSSVHVYKTTALLDGKPNIAYYVKADLSDHKLVFTTDTTLNRRFTPSQFYEKNDRPLLVVNTTFFSFETNRNLNVVIKDRKLVSYNTNSIAGRGKDTFTYRHPFAGAIGISKRRKADIAWTYTDSIRRRAFASQGVITPVKDSVKNPTLSYIKKRPRTYMIRMFQPLKKWKMQTAVGGGPVLLQNGEINITNEEEIKFAGKAINDKHPRTAMGYTKDNKLIILVIQGRFPGIAEGATLEQEAQILKDLGCLEALNLDGGGSSCMLVNGKETIKPSDKEGQRAVPAVFVIKSRQRATRNKKPAIPKPTHSPPVLPHRPLSGH